VARSRYSCVESGWPSLVRVDEMEVVRVSPLLVSILLESALALVSIAVNLSELSH